MLAHNFRKLGSENVWNVRLRMTFILAYIYIYLYYIFIYSAYNCTRGEM
jgi:hypothetical protein